MKKEVTAYVRRKIKEDFDRCEWTDGIGQKFEAYSIKEMRTSLNRLEEAFEEADKFYKETEELLSSIKTE